jgi:hypothetical protein
VVLDRFKATLPLLLVAVVMVVGLVLQMVVDLDQIKTTTSINMDKNIISFQHDIKSII